MSLVFHPIDLVGAYGIVANAISHVANVRDQELIRDGCSVRKRPGYAMGVQISPPMTTLPDLSIAPVTPRARPEPAASEVGTLQGQRPVPINFGPEAIRQGGRRTGDRVIACLAAILSTTLCDLRGVDREGSATSETGTLNEHLETSISGATPRAGCTAPWPSGGYRVFYHE